MPKVLTFLFLFALLFCVASGAQQAQDALAATPQHRHEAKSTKAKPDATQSSAELQDLIKALSGRWSLNVTGPNPSMPNGFAGAGEETWRPGPGGFTLLEEEHLRRSKGDLFLLGVLWWDSQTKRFRGMECQNLLPYTCDVKGSLTDIKMTWDGKQFIIEEQETHDGRKSVWHEVWSDITATSFTQTGESEEPGGARKRLFTIHATRVREAR